VGTVVPVPVPVPVSTGVSTGVSVGVEVVSTPVTVSCYSDSQVSILGWSRMLKGEGEALFLQEQKKTEQQPQRRRQRG
jgi:hypothetical protein